MAEPAENPAANPAQLADAARPSDDGVDLPAAVASSQTRKQKRNKDKNKETAKDIIKDATKNTDKDATTDAKPAMPPIQQPARPPLDQSLRHILEQNPALVQELAKSGMAATSKPSAVADLLRHLKLADSMTGVPGRDTNDYQDMAAHKFWSTQPVPRFGHAANSDQPDGPLEHKDVDSVPREPAPLLGGFEWVTMDVTVEAQMRELYELLNGHYVEDLAATFRFAYSPGLLRWALMAPGWQRDWHVGVRASESGKLVAFISAIPVRLRVRDRTMLCSEVNFLCVHKKLRNKRLAPVLIKEVTRRSNRHGIWQGLYTGGTLLPTPVATCRYYHRAINWPHLYESGFSALPGDSRPQLQIRRFALPDETALPGFREMQARDIDAVADLLARYLARFDLAPEFSRDELEHWMLNPGRKSTEPQVVWAYVVEDAASQKITDFISFYCLESSVINKASTIRAAYLFYLATDAGIGPAVDRDALRARLLAVVNDALVQAKQARFDVVNALSLMDNALFLDQAKFKPGDGALHYYLYNYRARPIAGGLTPAMALDDKTRSGVGLVML